MHLVWELLMNVQLSGGSMSFAKEMRALKTRSAVVGHPKLTMNNWEGHQGWSSCKYQRTCPISQQRPFHGRLAFEANWKGEKISVSGCFMSWLQIKNSSFWSIIFSCSMQPWQFLDWIVTCNEKWIFIWQPATASSADGLRRDSRAFPKAKLVSRKGSWALFGGLLTVWSTKAFWILAEPLHLRSTLSKSMRCTENCSAYSQHWSTERAQFFSMATPNRMSHNRSFTSGLQSFVFTWPLAHRLPFLEAAWQLFAWKMLPQPARCRKCCPNIRRIPKHGFLCYRNKRKYFSLAEMCWL